MYTIMFPYTIGISKSAKCSNRLTRTLTVCHKQRGKKPVIETIKQICVYKITNLFKRITYAVSIWHKELGMTIKYFRTSNAMWHYIISHE